MRARFFLPFILVWPLCIATSAARQDPATTSQQGAGIDSSNPSTSQSDAGKQHSGQTALSGNAIIDRVFSREKEQDEIIASYAPIVETYIQAEKTDPLMGTVPKSDFYFLGIADFRGKTVKVHSMTEKTHKGTIMWAFNPAGFLQMAFLDFGEFDKDHYKLTYRRRAFLGEVRCYVFDVERTPKTKGARFRGRIWVEDRDFTIVRMNGDYLPEIRFSVHKFEDEFYLNFDSWRTNVRSGVWLPSDIYSQDLRKSPPTGGPRFKARTHLWGYGLTTQNRQEELGRLLVESQNNVKDESERQDRSPLEQQRGWRGLSENNVFEVLERVGLIAPEGDVEKALNTIVNNIMATNSFDSRIEMHCRVLMTSDLEMFSMQNGIVLSRGLIDVVPNEETLAALLAFEMADAMEPKPAQDQYGFSDILRLTPTEALKKLSFVDNREEARKNSEKAMGWLKKSPYGDKLANVGLFLSQLQSQKPALKQLIKARLGNQVYFTSQLLQSAPALDPASLQQMGALPMGSRIKINPWNDDISLMKTQQIAPNSPREKIPFEVTPIDLYLTRYVRSSADVERSIVPSTAIPAAGAAGRD
ncbi:MAG: M48 family metalloprotease [Candidatus Acidiferrales bacterium]